MLKGDFTSNLGKVYGIYTGGFIAFVVLLAILEQVGVPNRFIGYMFIFLTIGIYAIIGILSRTAQISEYYVAGRRVPAIYNGMATGSDWMSGASFVGMAGTLYLLGYDGLAFVLGWTGGYVLVAVLLAPYLRKFGAFTVPDFLAVRFGGNLARFCGIVVLFCCSFTYVTAQIYATGIITSRFLGLSFEVAVFAGLLGILLCSMLGGMRDKGHWIGGESEDDKLEPFMARKFAQRTPRTRLVIVPRFGHFGFVGAHNEAIVHCWLDAAKSGFFGDLG